MPIFARPRVLADCPRCAAGWHSSPASGGTFHGLTPRGDAGGIYIERLVGSNGPEEIVKSVDPSRSDSARPVRE